MRLLFDAVKYGHEAVLRRIELVAPASTEAVCPIGITCARQSSP